MQKLLLLILFLFTMTYCIGQKQYATRYGDNIEAGGFKRVNGINLYYEIYGEGKPLVLLHGHGGSIEKQSDRIEYFKNYFRVIAIDSRRHGKSIDTSDRQLTYLQMASDINSLLDSLKIDSAYIWGQSDGGILGLLLAIHYPDKVSKLSTFAANLFPGERALFTEIDKMIRDTVRETKNEQRKQLYSLMAYQPDITVSDLKSIKCPVLTMSGDRDAIRLEHTLKIFYNIENSNLFIMPGATHFGAYNKTELFNKVLMDFLTEPFSKLSSVELFTGQGKK